MKEEEIINLWKQGLDKQTIANRYQRILNQYAKVLKLDIKHKDEKLITRYEALQKVENVIYQYIIKMNKTEKESKRIEEK